MELIFELWAAADPAAWRRAATDWRALAAVDAVARRDRAQLAGELGYASPNKINNLVADGRELRAAAASPDPQIAGPARERIRRAEALDRILREMVADD